MKDLSGEKINEFPDYLIDNPSTDTTRIQECHIIIGHIIWQFVEGKFYK